MTITDIITDLEYDHGKYRYKAVAEAIKQREAIIPELLRILSRASRNVAELEGIHGYTGHFYAIYLLAQLRAEQAYQPMIDLLLADPDLKYDVLGDVITEDMGRMLASVCGGDISLICALIENESLDVYVRSAGLSALVSLVATEVITREVVSNYFLSLFQGKLKREYSGIWGMLIGSCCDIYPEETLDEIERAFDDKIVDTSFTGRSWVRDCIKDGKDKTLKSLVSDTHNSLINDMVADMSRWVAYEKKNQPDVIKEQKFEQYWKPAPIPEEPKAGRNEPCPCGSGSKFKKCCGRFI